jgi:hypothetical protein
VVITTVEEFRQQVEQRRGERRRGAPRYPAELVAFAVRHARTARESGRSLNAAAGELGVSAMTLSTWAAQFSEPGETSHGRLREVVVQEERHEPASTEARGLELVTASGHKVHGLTVPELAALLRALS